MPVESNDNVAIPHTSLTRRTVPFQRNDENSTADQQIVTTNQTPMHRDVLACHAQVAATDLAVFDQSSGDEFRRIAGGCEANPLGRENDRRVDTNDLST